MSLWQQKELQTEEVSEPEKKKRRKPFDLEIAINRQPRSRVQLLVKQNGEWVEVKNDIYQVVLNKLRAVIYEALRE